MNLILRTNITKSNYFSLLFALFPISFIAGNMIININLLLIIISAFFFYKKDIFNIKFFILDKILIFLFFLIIFTGAYNDIEFIIKDLHWIGYFGTLIKSIFFLKYFFLYLVLRYLIEKNIIILKFFFISCSICVLFVCFDIFFQFVFGKDIFGYEIVGLGRKLSGPFGDELIAGSYIQRFSIFGFFIIPLFYNKFPNKILKYIILAMLLIVLAALILSGNRMPFISFLFSIFLILILQKQARKYFLSFIFIFSILFSIIINYNEQVRINFSDFYGQISKISSVVIKNFTEEKNVLSEKDERPLGDYLKEFSTFYDTWLLNKYIGGGIKNFRYFCLNRDNINPNAKFICNMHPHNYYLEILTDIGVAGLLSILVLFSIILYLTFYKKYFSISFLNKNNVIVPFLILFLTEIFPIKSTGSFFTTGNTTYLFLILSTLVALARKENMFEKRV